MVGNKKIIQHYLYSGLGGPGTVFFSLVEADRQKEIEYRAIFVGVEDLRDEYRYQCGKFEIPYSYLKKKKGFDLSAYFKVFRAFRKDRPDTIFLHGVGFSIIPAFWYKITRPRIRILVRDTQAHHLKSRSEWFWMFFCLLLAKRMIFLTQASADGIKKKFGWWARSRKLVIIPNGLNMDKYKPKAGKGNENPSLIIGMQSRLQPIKDHPTLIKAFRQLKQKFPAKPLYLYIAGDGETMAPIKKMIADIGMENEIDMKGMLGETELLSFMNSLDIYVQATFGETLSNSIMQAMAFGLPVVASDVWGVNNMIQHGENGLLYASEDVDQLVLLLQQLITDIQLRERLGHDARKFAEEHYSNSVMFENYRSLYA